MNYTTRESCRCCGCKKMVPLFSLGEQWVSDFVSEARQHSEEMLKVSIELEMCPKCTLVQAKHSPPPEVLWRGNYWYRSGTNQTMRDHLENVALAAQREAKLVHGDVVLDIGSNDGTLLRSYNVPGLVRIGVEPAANLQEDGRREIDLLINNFWDIGAWRQAMGPDAKAKAITACGMLYDLEDPNCFVRDVAEALAPDGVFIAQLMCLRGMLRLRDVGNLAHEHLEFYSLRSLETLLKRHRLYIYDLETNDCNGESYRLYCRHVNEPGNPRDFKGYQGFVVNGLAAENRMKLDDPAILRGWLEECCKNRDAVHQFVLNQKYKGNKVWVYGASTKGNVLLQWYGLDRSVIEAAADRNPAKHGLFTVGTGIPIKSEDEFRRGNPDFALVLPYAFFPEFCERESEWCSKGGKFIVPLPELRIV
jgi:NDP-4-keto-2,6-dideoxyhexose 3-C-methyltransferase